ncbi:unnamed protein product [Rhizophagus irregularis]|nr:unnamed protein product [Rhizophagus irregularis]
MFDVIEAIDIWMQKEALNKSFLAWKYKTIAYHQPFVVETFFSKINSVIQKYLTPHIIEEIHKQMCESVLYRCEKLEINDAFEFNEDQSVDQVMLNEDESSDQKDEVINITEDYYDFCQAYLNALLNSISKESIDEIW